MKPSRETTAPMIVLPIRLSSRGCRRGYEPAGSVRISQMTGKLGSPADPELRICLVQVMSDGARAEEQLRGDLAVAHPARGPAHDLQLLRGQLTDPTAHLRRVGYRLAKRDQ